MSDIAYADDEFVDIDQDPMLGQADEFDAEEQPEDDTPWLIKAINSPNLAFELDDRILQAIGAKVCDEFDMDCQSRKDEGWDEIFENSMELAMQVKKAKTYPWQDAANIKYPLLTTASIQFAARAYPAIVDGWNVVKGKVLGQPSDEKRQRADRMAAHMSYQLLEEMEGWEEDTDRLLHMLPITGCVFRKTYFDPQKGTNCSELVSPDKGVANYWTRDMETCPRFTHVCTYYRNECEEKFRAEVWKRIEMGASASDDEYAPEEYLEQHRLWDIDDDGYPEPYIVTVHKESQQVVRIVARFDEEGIVMRNGEVERIEPVRYFTKYSFMPSPDGSFYDIGFGSLLNSLSETINSTINMLMDAGHLANIQGGFLGAGISLRSGNMPIKPGEWRRVQSTGQSLRDSIVPLPVKEPSAVLFNLLGMLIESAKDITATKDVLTGDSTPQNQPVGTTLALIEQGLKVYSAIYKRIHRAFRQELAKLRRLNKLYLDPQAYFTFQDVEGVVSQEDYASEDADVIPVSDPTIVMDSQRLGRAQYLIQFLGNPLMDQKAIIEYALEAGSIPDTESFFVKEQGPSPEVMIKGKELELKEKDLAVKGRGIQINQYKAETDRMKIEGVPAKTTAEAIRTIYEAAAIREEHGLQDIQPGELQSLEGPPVEPAILPVPQGPAGPVDQGMVGDGGGNAPVQPPQGPPPGGIGGPEMV